MSIKNDEKYFIGVVVVKRRAFPIERNVNTFCLLLGIKSDCATSNLLSLSVRSTSFVIRGGENIT